MASTRSDLLDQRMLQKRDGGSEAGRIREEAAAICLHIEYSMCEKQAGRYESHELSCKCGRG